MGSKVFKGEKVDGGKPGAKRLMEVNKGDVSAQM